MSENKMKTEAYRRVKLCVDSYDAGHLTGRCYHPGMAEGGRKINSLAQFLVGMETLLDEMNFPQSYTAIRSFAPVEGRCGELPEEQDEHGKLATFQIRLMFRQHASWQGSITWVEGKGEQSFRSVIELIMLMDSALGGCMEEI